jgi:hypothetical protein
MLNHFTIDNDPTTKSFAMRQDKMILSIIRAAGILIMRRSISPFREDIEGLQ